MTFSANRNLFEVPLAAVWDAYGPHLSGAPGSLLCAISQHPLNDDAVKALDNSASALGFGSKGCTYVCLQVAGGSNQEASELGANDLQMIIEGADPLALVACDSHAAALLSQAYNCQVAPDRPNRVLGRTCVAFVQLESLLGTPEDKQKAWALLKTLR